MLNFYIIFFSILCFLHEKPQNYKVIGVIEIYNFYIKVIFFNIVLKSYDFLKV